MSGVEVAREVREMGCPVYIVGCTGNALREDQEEYIAAGADGVSIFCPSASESTFYRRRHYGADGPDRSFPNLYIRSWF